MSKQVVLQVSDLFFIYPKTSKQILNGVNLEIYQNEMVSITGKLGNGKSTLLRHLNAILKPQIGDVLIKQISVAENPNRSFHQEVGLLFENPDDQIFYPVVSDDIAFGPRNLGLSKNKVYQRVIEACEQLGILHLLERETSSLSFGEKTLVALAGILAMRNDIILLDSPEIGLDLWTKPDILKLLHSLKTEHTIVITTNDLDILRLSDRIFLLWDGKIRDVYNDFSLFKKAMSKY
ncbi:MAG: ABC transporter ATP-binding protein [Candidatus Heimdallarchaeota archaeon]|nr:ABC transporter ATP-binding protein [Candidatus Heimdallarchaeota archaeon]